MYAYVYVYVYISYIYLTSSTLYRLYIIYTYIYIYICVCDMCCIHMHKHDAHVCLCRSRDIPTFSKPCVPSSCGTTGTILLGSIEASPEENIPIGVFLAVNSMAALVNKGTI